VPPTPEAAALSAALAALPLVVDTVEARVGPVAVPAYPDGARPSGEVRLAGGGAEGRGEHVAWTLADQRRFRDALPALVPRSRTRLGEWAAEVARRTAEPYARAALEAAAIDLALRQQGTSLPTLAGLAPRPLRYVVSFDRRTDPLPEAQRIVAAAPGVGLKIDVDPTWDDGTYAALAALDAVAVLDWKGTGTVADHVRAHRALPAALLEDPAPGPWPPEVAARVSLDAALGRAADVAALPHRPAAVNVKPARMGGVLEALAAIAACAAADIPVYVGGMFEVGVGRAQLQTLAALFAPEMPNDVAPIGVGTTSPTWPRRLLLPATGVGFPTTVV
jgi:L-alanine-DL-glutamate epimerase-like enolase superfamily enzyme